MSSPAKSQRRQTNGFHSNCILQTEQFSGDRSSSAFICLKSGRTDSSSTSNLFMIGPSVLKLRSFLLISGTPRIGVATAAAIRLEPKSPAIYVRRLLSQFSSDNLHRACSIARFRPYNEHHRDKLSSSLSIQRFFGTSSAHRVTVCKVFDDMPQRVLNSRSITFNRVLSLLMGGSDISTAHCLAVKIGALSHLPVLTSLIMAYSRAGQLNRSCNIFNEINFRDVIICNAMITSLLDYGRFKEAVDLFLEMLSCQIGFSSTSLLLIVSALICSGSLSQGRALHGLAVTSGGVWDSSLCNSLTDMYAKFGDIVSAELVFHEIGSRRDNVSWNSMMSGFLHGNDPEKCLQCFLGRARNGEKGDNFSLSCTISAASSLRELRCGQMLHGLSSKVGLENNTYNNSVSNALVCFYSACGQSEAAEKIFEEIKIKDTISWNTVIEGLRVNGEIGGAFHLLYEMQFVAQSQPDKMTLLTINSICADEMLLVEGRAAHGFILRGGMESDSSLVNSLIYMYGKCGSVENARFLFECMIPRRDSVSWNTMISAYTQSGLNISAQTSFRGMLKGSLEISAASLLAVLPSCDSPEFLVFSKLIHSLILKSGISNNDLVLNSVIYSYINCGELNAALSLFQRDADREDVTSWNIIITGYVQSGYFREALDAFHLLMREGNVNFDFITIISILSACGNLELVRGGELIHGLAVKALLESETRVQNSLVTMYGRCGQADSARSIFNTIDNRNLCSWNCMISVFCQDKNPIEALNLFCHLDLEPDEFTISGIITACTQLGSIRLGKQIHCHILRHRLHENPVICSALLDMYSNCGRLDFATQVFRLLPTKSVVAYNSMISAYGYHSDGKKAVEIFLETCHSNQPNNGTFTSLLSACSHSGLIKEGLYYYHHMFRDFGVEPIADHRVCVIDMLGRAGELREAYKFIMEMAPEPESGPLGALLSWCNFYGNIELGREVAEVLFKVDPGNTGYYISLSNMYVAAGRWKEAVELREMVDMKRLRKPPGYSLIDSGSL